MRGILRFATVTMAGIGVLMLVGQAAAQPLAGELKCELAVGKGILSKFVAKKAGCIAKCNKKTPGDASCNPSYAGDNALCISTAEGKANVKIASKCLADADPAKDKCPECYNGGDCTNTASGYAQTKVNDVETQVDAFVTLIWCNYGTNTVDQQKCQVAVSKTLTKLVGKMSGAAAKCVKAQGLTNPAASPCDPAGAGPTDPALVAAVQKAADKAKAAIDKKCGGTGATDPKCGASPCPNNPSCWLAPFEQNGSSWVPFTQNAVDGNYASIYCEN